MSGTRNYLPKVARVLSLAERLVAFSPRNGVIGPAIAALVGKRSVTVTFLPTISDPEVLADLTFRASWYLSPMGEKLRAVIFPVTPEAMISEGEQPDYLDGESAECLERLAKLFTFRETLGLEAERQLVADSDIVLVWDSKLWDPPTRLASYGVFRRGGRTFFNVDRQTSSREASTWLDVPRLLGACRLSVVAECREKFEKLAESMKEFSRAYVFGTGPNLEQVADAQLLDGVRVVSNSLIRNETLMEKIRPSIVCCGDPVFHAGCSGYAAEFRRNLATAMARYPDLHAIVPITHYPYYCAHFPADLLTRVIGVPIKKLGRSNLDLLDSYHVNQTGNILTMLMLPVAATLAREIYVGGCDGRSNQAQQYFWSHHAPSQIVDKMNAAKEAHPGFFKISYTDYYDQHCETLEQLVREGERQGRIFRNVTTSFVPALERRDFSTPPVHVSSERPRVYTFCAPIHGKVPEHEAALVDLWRESWEANGWDPVVLNESSVQVDEEVAHMLLAFRALPSINRKKLDYYCYMRWLAVAQAGGGFMCDYDVINYDFHPRSVGNLTLYEESIVPCLVGGRASEYERVARLFAAYEIESDDRMQGKSHISDMMILKKNIWMFEQSSGCAEFGHPGWQTASAVHFSNLSMKSRSLMPRHDHIPSLRPWQPAAATP